MVINLQSDDHDHGPSSHPNLLLWMKCDFLYGVLCNLLSIISWFAFLCYSRNLQVIKVKLIGFFMILAQISWLVNISLYYIDVLDYLQDTTNSGKKPCWFIDKVCFDTNYSKQYAIVLSIFISELFYSLALWFFGMSYWVASLKMSYESQHLDTKKLMKSIQIFNAIVTFVLVGSPLFAAIFFMIQGESHIKQSWNLAYNLTIQGEQLFSVIFLGDGLRRIKQVMKQQQMSLEISLPAMCTNFFCFLLFFTLNSLNVVLNYFISKDRFAYEKVKGKESYLIVYGVIITVGAISQSLFIYICFKISISAKKIMKIQAFYERTPSIVTEDQEIVSNSNSSHLEQNSSKKSGQKNQLLIYAKTDSKNSEIDIAVDSLNNNDVVDTFGTLMHSPPFQKDRTPRQTEDNRQSKDIDAFRMDPDNDFRSASLHQDIITIKKEKRLSLTSRTLTEDAMIDSLKRFSKKLDFF